MTNHDLGATLIYGPNHFKNTLSNVRVSRGTAPLAVPSTGRTGTAANIIAEMTKSKAILGNRRSNNPTYERGTVYYHKSIVVVSGILPSHESLILYLLSSVAAACLFSIL